MPWYTSTEFQAFVPYMYAKPADDKRQKKHSRLEFKGNTPGNVLALALKYEAPCVACQRGMHPFRDRNDGSIYLAVSCPQAYNIGCSKGRKASNAYDVIEALINRNPSPGEQRRLWES